VMNLANASRLFYVDEHPRNRQSSAYWEGDPQHVICYEGCRRNLDNGNMFYVFKGVLADEGPYGIGDQMKRQNSVTDICPYGSSWVGMLASLVDTTNVERILKLDCNVTDFYGNNEFPTYLYFNPYYEPRNVEVNVGSESVDIYDLVSKEMVSTNVQGKMILKVGGDKAMVIRLLPAGTKVRGRKGKLYAGEMVIDYNY